MPREAWDNPAAYDEKTKKLVGPFKSHFEEYQDMASPEIAKAGPQVQVF